MAWQTPKIDWKSSDYINVADWSRIEENTQYLSTELNIDIESLVLDRSVQGFPFASYLNFLARNIVALGTGYVEPVGWQLLSSAWGALQGLSYTTINVMENNLKILKETRDSNKAVHNYCGELYCGEKGGLLWATL